MKLESVLTAAIISCLAPGASAATILFSTAGLPANGNVNIGSNRWAGLEFSSDSSNLTLSSADLRLFPSSGSFSLDLYANNSGKPGLLIANLATQSVSIGGIAWVTFPLNYDLAPLTDYWLVLSGADSAWETTNSAAGGGSGFHVGIVASIDNGITWGGNSIFTPKAVIYVTPTPTPEPTPMLLLGIGVIGMLGLRCRRNSHLQNQQQ